MNVTRKRTIELPFDEVNKSGKKVCVWCGGALPGRARRWCGMKCVTEWQARSGYYYRAQGLEQNRAQHGGSLVCDSCGCSLEVREVKLPDFDPECSEAYYHRDILNNGPNGARLGHQREYCARFVTPRAEVDHVKALALGGTHELANLRVLCVKCHRRKTREDVRELAATRKFGPSPGQQVKLGGQNP